MAIRFNRYRFDTHTTHINTHTHGKVANKYNKYIVNLVTADDDKF